MPFKCNLERYSAVMDPMPDFPERASALEKTVEDGAGESADAAAAKKVRSAGGALPAPANGFPANGGGGLLAPAPLTPTASSVPTMGLEDLLGGGGPIAPAASNGASAAAAPAGFTVNQGLEDLLGGAVAGLYTLNAVDP